MSSYKYVKLLAVVITGRWHVPEGTAGTVQLSLMDRRLNKLHEAVLLTTTSNTRYTEFQVKTHPNYTMVTSDCMSDPFELFVSVRDLDMPEGYFPLSLEIAFSVICCDVILLKSLKLKLKLGVNDFVNATGDVGSEGLDDFLESGNLQSLRSNVARSKNMITTKKRRDFQGRKRETWKEVGNGYKVKSGVVISDVSDSENGSEVSKINNHSENGKLQSS